MYKTLKGRYPYKSLRDTLDKIQDQIEISVPFAVDFIEKYCKSSMHTIERPVTVQALFDLLKSKTHYRDDPKGIELIQSMPSLFLNNYYNSPGTGDCDCFTVTACASMIAEGLPTGFTIYGNGLVPTHIAADYWDYKYQKKQRVPFDLVAPGLGIVKKYRWNRSYELTP